jgi:HlyD family secretion protein
MSKATKIITVLILLLTVAMGCFIFMKRPKAVTASAANPMEITGSIEAKEIDVNVKIPGRVTKVPVEEGDGVVQGQPIAMMEADSIQAKAQLARAALEAATAQYVKAKKGARPQQLEQARDMMIQADSGYKLAQSTYNRLQQLYNDGVLAEQKLDMARTECDVAKTRYNAAKEQFDLVKEGAQREDIDSAAALVRQAQAAYDEVMTYIHDATVKAPITGVITMKSVEPGEMVSTGMPIVTISDLKDVWVEVKVRETALSHFHVGENVPVHVMGAPGRVYQGRIVFIGAKPSFATERATQEKGEQDIVSFGVKIKLPNTDLKLRPGMTATVMMK